MGADARALRQKEKERRRLNSAIDTTDRWIDQRVKYADSMLPEPPADMDEAGLERYARELAQAFDEQIGGLTQLTRRQISKALDHVADLGVEATMELVAAELPTPEEVWRGRSDQDRSR